MKRVLAPALPKAGRDVELSESESHHVIQVLRLRDGDTVEALDGKGQAALVKLRIRNKTVFLSFAESTVRKSDASQVLPIDLEVAVLKGDAMEWVVEKAVELGVRSLTPLLTAHTVVQVDRKGPEAFQERWQRIADQALKQCGRLERLEVKMPVALEDHLAATSASGQRILADEQVAGSGQQLQDLLRARVSDFASGIRILIGPEGGWSDKERGLLPTSVAASVSLGPLILRAETACLYSASIAAAFFRAIDKS